MGWLQTFQTFLSRMRPPQASAPYAMPGSLPVPAIPNVSNAITRCPLMPRTLVDSYGHFGMLWIRRAALGYLGILGTLRDAVVSLGHFVIYADM